MVKYFQHLSGYRIGIFPGEQFVKHHAERVYVRARVNFILGTARLFRRHVWQRAHDFLGQ